MPSQNKALVVSTYGRDNLVEFAGKLYNCTKRSNIQKLIVGDLVEFDLEVITKLLPRKNLLTNGNKNIASNIDTIFLTLAIKPYPQLHSIDNYLIKANSNNINLSILINKSDILDKKNIDVVAKIYQDIGYSVDFISVENCDNLEVLNTKSKNKTCVFLGQSGVGKSSIVNYLTNNSQKINNLGKDGLGKHTTTSSRVFSLNNGGKVIDTPGVREFNPDDLNKKEIINGFKEIKKYAPLCKFNDCLHINEPNCEVKKQLELGNISQYRYNNYKRLLID